MKFFIIIASSCMLMYSYSLQGQVNLDNYELVWEDNFDSLNTDIWKVQNNFDHYGGELQVYTDRQENVFVEDGEIVLRVNREDYLCPSKDVNFWSCSKQFTTGETYEYTSGWIESRKDYNTKYGYVEARIKLPYGRGFWPAFWTFVGEGLKEHENAGEIDIFEMYGHKPPYYLSTNIHLYYCNENYEHYPDCSAIGSYGKSHLIESYANRYHTYSLEWSEETIKWRMNDQLIRVRANPGVVDSLRFILNMAILKGDPPNSITPFPSDMKIDYIRVYKPKEIIVSTEEEREILSNQIEIYPNPVSEGEIHLFTSFELGASKFKIYNGLGKILMERNLEQFNEVIDVSNMLSGQYIIEIVTKKGTAVKSFVKL